MAWNLFFSILYAIIAFLFLLYLMRILSIKGELHFNMIKLLNPEKLKDVKSFYQLMFSLKAFFQTDLATIFRITTPIYFGKLNLETCNERILFFHNCLIKNRKQFLIVFSIYVLWLFGAGWIILG